MTRSFANIRTGSQSNKGFQYSLKIRGAKRCHGIWNLARCNRRKIPSIHSSAIGWSIRTETSTGKRGAGCAAILSRSGRQRTVRGNHWSISDCSWGRWTIAAARAGFRPVGVDVHIDALAAGNRVAGQLRASAEFICADAEHLPFQPGSIDFVFSYSVLQHLEKKKVVQIFKEIFRVLRPGGICLIQLPNMFGVYSILQQLKRGFREARVGTFEMRYWTRSQIRQTIQEAGMQSLVIRADGFFSQNAQVSDMDLLSPAGRRIVLASALGRRAAAALPVLTHLADSLWIEARKNPN